MVITRLGRLIFISGMGIILVIGLAAGLVWLGRSQLLVERAPTHRPGESRENTNGQKGSGYVKIIPNPTDFFVELRLGRDRSRAWRIEFLKELLDRSQDTEVRKSAEGELLALTRRGEAELEIESLVKARGYREAVALIGDRWANVVVETESLAVGTARQIGEITSRVTGLPASAISILERTE